MEITLLKDTTLVNTQKRQSSVLAALISKAVQIVRIIFQLSWTVIKTVGAAIMNGFSIFKKAFEHHSQYPPPRL